MLTPQEVSERAFPKASFGGYNMAQVDEFLDVLTEDYSALYSENAVLKSKMKVLVEKVEEYRSTEEAMRKALMAAQRMADDLVKEAEQKRAQILEEAEAEAGRKVEAIRQEEEAERFRLESAQKETASYVAQVRALHAKAAEYLDQLSQLTPPAPSPARWRRPSPTSTTASSAWWPRPWPRRPPRTRRPARRSPSRRTRANPRKRTARRRTWAIPPASTSGSSSSAGTTRSNKSGYQVKTAASNAGGCLFVFICISGSPPPPARHSGCYRWPASSQAPYPSPRRVRQGSLSPLLLLSHLHPLRWAANGGPAVGQGPLFYLNFRLSATASSSQRLL